MAKSSRRRQDLPVEQPRTNTPLLFLMLLLVPLFGGYYNFSVLAWGAALLLLRRPAARLLWLALRSSVGLAVLALLSQASQFTGINLGVNLINALVLGLLGAPGFGLLLMLQWALR